MAAKVRGWTHGALLALLGTLVSLSLGLGGWAFLLRGGADLRPATVTPSPEPPTATFTPSPTATATPTSTPSPTPTATSTPTPTPSSTPWPWGEPVVIGYSVEGRPLEVYRFGQGPRHRMIVAGVHGGYEGNTVRLAYALIEALREHPQVVPPQVSLFILPNLNPDGYARHQGIYGRANAHGVDLNRNFPVNWKPDWNRRGCWDYLPITAGPFPFSEPETQALRDFLLRPEVHLEAFISYHSAALGIFPAALPPHFVPHPPSEDLARQLAAVTGYRYPPLDTGCEYTGQMVDWMAFAFGAAAVDVELNNHQDIDFEQNWAALRVFLQWTWTP